MTSSVPPTIENLKDSLRITISMGDPRSSNYSRNFLVFWLIGWACGEISVITILLTGQVFGVAREILADESLSVSLPVWLKDFVHESLFVSLDAWFKDFVYESLFLFVFVFICVWLFFWTLGGGYFLYILLKELTGKEVIEVNSQSITVRRQVLNFSLPTKEYLAENIKYLRILPVQASSDPYSSSWDEIFWKLSTGPIAFDWGTTTIRFGGRTDQTEAKQIVTAIQESFPQYCISYADNTST